MSGRVRVLVWYRCPHGELESFTDAFRRIGAQLAGLPGWLGSELLRARREEGSLVVMSEWESVEAFARWESSAGHRPTTAPLRGYLDDARPYTFELYRVMDSVAAASDGPGSMADHRDIPAPVIRTR